MTPGGVVFGLMVVGIGAWLWLREQHWQQEWRRIGGELGLQRTTAPHALAGKLGDAGLEVRMERGAMRLSVRLPPGRLAGITVHADEAGPGLRFSAEKEDYARGFLAHPGVGDGLEALLRGPEDRLHRGTLRLVRPPGQAGELRALLREVSLLVDAMRDAPIQPARRPPTDPFFVAPPEGQAGVWTPLEPDPPDPPEALG